MRYNPKQYARALYELASEAKESERPAIVRRFARVLWERNDIGKFKEIARAFAEYGRKQEHKVRVEVTAASDIKISNAVFGDNAEVVVKKDPALLGGVILKINDLLVDNSVAGRLRRFKKALHI